MSCYVKLKENCYINWSKASDSPAENKIYNKEEIFTEISKNYQSLVLLNKNTLNPTDLFNFLEQNGTTDLGKAVDKKFIEKYNTLGDNNSPLSIDEIINFYKN